MALAGAALVTGLATGRPELVVIATPVLLLVGVGLAASGEPRLTAAIAINRERIIEGETATVTVTIRNHGAAADLEVALRRTAHVDANPAGPVLLRLPADAAQSLTFAARPQRWGAHALGPLVVRARDPLGLRVWEARLGDLAMLCAFPEEQALRQLVTPLRTQPFLGAHVARLRGSGIEFADIRPFTPGDRVRQVNWRATARRGTLHVTDRHPEHASDVVLLLDTFAEARDRDSGTLDAAVRAAASLARAHLARRDRVALVDFGGTLHWLEPAFGSRQLYRIVDALLASDIAFSYASQAAPLECAGHRDHAPARRALDPPDHRPAHPRSGPHRRRGLPRTSHRAGAHPRRPCRLSTVEAGAPGSARTATGHGHRRCGVE
jgi:uncharacterized protein (DUF58 family)